MERELRKNSVMHCLKIASYVLIALHFARLLLKKAGHVPEFSIGTPLDKLGPPGESCKDQWIAIPFLKNNTVYAIRIDVRYPSLGYVIGGEIYHAARGYVPTYVYMGTGPFDSTITAAETIEVHVRYDTERFRSAIKKNSPLSDPGYPRELYDYLHRIFPEIPLHVTVMKICDI